MTTKSGGTEKPPQDTHLISVYDNIGEAKTWCGVEFAKNTESLTKTTCLLCLKAVVVYGQGASQQLRNMSPFTPNLYLDVDFETARALHRVVRGMHDGECPKCHHLHESPAMRRYVEGKLIFDLVCPNPECQFTITAAEQHAAIQAFAPVMERNLAVFEQWSARR